MIDDIDDFLKNQSYFVIARLAPYCPEIPDYKGVKVWEFYDGKEWSDDLNPKVHLFDDVDSAKKIAPKESDVKCIYTRMGDKSIFS